MFRLLLALTLAVALDSPSRADGWMATETIRVTQAKHVDLTSVPKDDARIVVAVQPQEPFVAPRGVADSWSYDYERRAWIGVGPFKDDREVGLRIRLSRIFPLSDVNGRVTVERPKSE